MCNESLVHDLVPHSFEFPLEKYLREDVCKVVFGCHMSWDSDRGISHDFYPILAHVQREAQDPGSSSRAAAAGLLLAGILLVDASSEFSSRTAQAVGPQAKFRVQKTGTGKSLPKA